MCAFAVPDRSSGIWHTAPVNLESRLRMLTSSLLLLAEAEEVVDAMKPSESVEGSLAASGTRGGGSLGGRGLATPHEEGRGPKGAAASQGSPVEDAATQQTSEAIPNPYEGIGRSMSLRPAPFMPEGTLILETRSINTPTHEVPVASKAAQIDTAEMSTTDLSGVSVTGNSKDGSELQEATEIDGESLRHAKATALHIRKQLSVLDTHAVQFSLTFHLLASVSLLSRRLHRSVLSRLINSLSIAAVGELRQEFTWTQALLRRMRRGQFAKRPSIPELFRRVPELAEGTKERDTQNPFNVTFLPASIEEAAESTRKAWKRLLKSDTLSVYSAACKRDVSVPPGVLFKGGNAVGSELATKSGPNDRATEICSSSLWLELQARIALEKEVLLEQQLFPYFIRMGLENVQFVHKAIEQGTCSLWN